MIVRWVVIGSVGEKEREREGKGVQRNNPDDFPVSLGVSIACLLFNFIIPPTLPGILQVVSNQRPTERLAIFFQINKPRSPVRQNRVVSALSVTKQTQIKLVQSLQMCVIQDCLVDDPVEQHDNPCGKSTHILVRADQEEVDPR